MTFEYAQPRSKGARKTVETAEEAPATGGPGAIARQASRGLGFADASAALSPDSGMLAPVQMKGTKPGLDRQATMTPADWVAAHGGANHAATADSVATTAIHGSTGTMEAQLKSYLTTKLGAKGARWWRSKEVREFRGKMKKAGRAKAYAEINDEVAGQGDSAQKGDATKAYMQLRGRKVAYKEAKGSVNAALTNFAEESAFQFVPDGRALLTAAARAAALEVLQAGGDEATARTAATAAAAAALPDAYAVAEANAKAWKDKLLGKAYTPAADIKTIGSAHQAAKGQVEAQVHDDKVAEKSVKTALSAPTTGRGLQILGRLVDGAAPEPGDSCKLSVELNIPIGAGGFVLIKVSGECERGDDGDMKASVELTVGGGYQIAGLVLDGSLSFFLRAGGKDTATAMAALSYGGYRHCCGKERLHGLANWWAGVRQDKASIDARKSVGKTRGSGKALSDVEEAEIWAAMMEEVIFTKVDDTGQRVADEAGFAEVGAALQAHAAANAGVVEGEASIRGELYSRYDHAQVSQVVSNYLASKRPPAAALFAELAFAGPERIGVGNAGTTAADAQDRRKQLRGKSTKKLIIEAGAKLDVAGQKCEFTGQFAKEFGDAWEVDLGATLNLDTTGDVAEFTRIAVGICTASTTMARTIGGIYKNRKNANASQNAGAALNIGADIASIVDSGGLKGQLGSALSNAWKVDEGKMDKVHGGLAEHFGAEPPVAIDPEAPEEMSKGAGGTLGLKVGIKFTSKKEFELTISQVKKVELKGKVGSAGIAGGIERSTRLASLQRGEDGKIEGNLLGISKELRKA